MFVRWISTPKKLSREQMQALRKAAQANEPFALSAISLVELAVLFSKGRSRPSKIAPEVFSKLEANPAFEILPITIEIAAEIAELGEALRDPSDRTIVATARVHQLRLVTSDQRIIDSSLVPVIS